MRFDGLQPGADPLKARPSRPPGPLTEVVFAPNPGNLRMFSYLPPGLEAGAPLVVSLHGCGQTAAGYGLDAGWCQLAAELGFALLAPEQKAANNPNTCFNWFNPQDIARGEGEAASIAAMIQTMVETHRLDKSRVFISGLSAGGAMTAVMLATYPEWFAGGAIIAGLPFGVAANLREALDAMRAAPLKTPQQWGDLVRAASAHQGPWPDISIWHGALDTTVNISNAQASAAQWADLKGLKLTEARQEMIDGAVHLAWDGQLEVYTLPVLGHGTPIHSGDVGKPAPFVLEAGISSSRRIADFWGLTTHRSGRETKPPPPPRDEAAAQPQSAAARRENVILRALKAAGLLGEKRR